MFQYPQTATDPTALLGELGILWSELYQDNITVSSLMQGKLLLQQSAVAAGQVLLDACSRRTIQPTRPQRWVPLTLTQSQMNDTEWSLNRWGGGWTWGDGDLWDIPTVKALYSWTLPRGLISAALLCNRLTYPSRTLVNGVDFQIDGQYIVFNSDPFADPLIPQDVLVEGDLTVATQVQLWLYDTQWDKDDLTQQFGYALGVDLPSTRRGRDLLNAVFDGLNFGPTQDSVHRLCEAATGIDLAAGAETVEVVEANSDRLLVITDQRVYTFASTANPLVAVGDLVGRGDALCDALIFWPARSGVPDPTLFPSLILRQGRELDVAVGGDLTFTNTQEALVLTPQSDGSVELSWALGGNADAVTAFFALMHQRGIAVGTPPASLLMRQNHLPGVINPLGFLCQQVLNNHGTLLRINPDALGADACGLEYLHLLSMIQPPQSLLLRSTV